MTYHQGRRNKNIVVPPWFACASRQRPLQVLTYPGAVTGAPVAAYAANPAVGARLRDHVPQSPPRPFPPTGLSVAYLFAYSSLRCLLLCDCSLLYPTFRPPSSSNFAANQAIYPLIQLSFRTKARLFSFAGTHKTKQGPGDLLSRSLSRHCFLK